MCGSHIRIFIIFKKEICYNVVKILFFVHKRPWWQEVTDPSVGGTTATTYEACGFLAT
jgi:hypothetical protein